MVPPSRCASAGQIVLGPFSVDLVAMRVRRDGIDVPLRRQAFRVFKVFVENPGKLIQHEELIREAWDGVLVSNHTVVVTISELKNALGEFGSWIVYRPRLGYTLEIPTCEDLIRTGRHYLNQFSRTGLENALRCFQQAARTDTVDARAYQAISNTYLAFGALLMGRPGENHSGFQDAHQRAVALSGTTPELQLDRGYARFTFELRPAQAETELIAVLRQRPRQADIYVRLAMVHVALGRLDDARADMQHAQSADPLLPQLGFVWTALRLFRGEFEEAVECGKRTVELHPSSQIGRADYAAALEFTGRTEEALAQFKLASSVAADTPWIQARYGICLAKTGSEKEAGLILAELQRNRESNYIDPYHLALLLCALGRPDEAFCELQRAYEEKSWAVFLLRVDPRAEALRAHPRVAAFCRGIFETA
jgi:DNA-binding winged helix-turn-helix (wHTH) protein/Flp pilus assembly protein TadD